MAAGGGADSPTACYKQFGAEDNRLRELKGKPKEELTEAEGAELAELDRRYEEFVEDGLRNMVQTPPSAESPGSELHRSSLAECCCGEEASGTLLQLAVLSAAGFTLFGYDTGVVSGAIQWVTRDLGLSPAQESFGVGATPLAAALSCLAAAPLCEGVGRRGGVQVAAVLYVAGALVVSAAQGFASFAIGRVILGLAIGIATTAVPMYAAECAPAAVRGRMMVANDLCIVAGQVLAGVMNVACEHLGGDWRLSMGLAALPAALQLVGSLLLPESPRWLLLKGKPSQASQAMRRLRHHPNRAELELDEAREALQSEAAHDQDSLAQRIVDMWRTASLRRAMTLGLVLMAMNQFSGINAVMYFSTDILIHAGLSEETSVLFAMVCDVAQLLGVCISLMQMDKYGRRYLGLRSSVLVVPFLLLLAAALAVGGVRELDYSPAAAPEQPEAGTTVSHTVAVVSLMGYLVSFGLGLSAVPWTVNAEIYPLRDRSKAQAQASFTNWVCNSVVSVTFLPMLRSLGAGVFLVYAFIATVGGTWMWKHMPETKGLSLEQGAALFNRPLREAVRETPLLRASSRRQLARAGSQEGPVDIGVSATGHHQLQEESSPKGFSGSRSGDVII
eukprot:TRINITY_DN5397_c0_g2_i1.p1 TRINITY_DN5397_c0_g2~~TRINITY_DN5397_c0_g2_i1.p1  ORF type:complete len:637 (+),score=205.17 TRINITY_DN5397_c0_g2_i1:63-1913(+)